MQPYKKLNEKDIHRGGSINFLCSTACSQTRMNNTNEEVPDSVLADRNDALVEP